MDERVPAKIERNQRGDRGLLDRISRTAVLGRRLEPSVAVQTKALRVYTSSCGGDAGVAASARSNGLQKTQPGIKRRRTLGWRHSPCLLYYIAMNV
jgi:hypothetical protein